MCLCFYRPLDQYSHFGWLVANWPYRSHLRRQQLDRSGSNTHNLELRRAGWCQCGCWCLSVARLAGSKRYRWKSKWRVGVTMRPDPRCSYPMQSGSMWCLWKLLWMTNYLCWARWSSGSELPSRDHKLHSWSYWIDTCSAKERDLRDRDQVHRQLSVSIQCSRGCCSGLPKACSLKWRSKQKESLQSSWRRRRPRWCVPHSCTFSLVSWEYTQR